MRRSCWICACAPAMSPANSSPRTTSAAPIAASTGSRGRRGSNTAGSRIRRSSSRQERLKIEERLPAAQKFIREQKLNELIPGEIGEIGIIVLGGLTNGLLRALARLDLADLYGASRIPIYVLNVAYPLVPDEVKDFCAGKRAVLVVEEGSPELRRAASQCRAARRRYPDPRARQGLPAAQRRLHVGSVFARHRRFPVGNAPGRHRCRRRGRASRGDARAQIRTSPLLSAIFRRGRRISVPAVRSGRSLPR